MAEQAERSAIQEAVDAGWIDAAFLEGLAPIEAALDEAQANYQAAVDILIGSGLMRSEPHLAIVMKVLAAMAAQNRAYTDFQVAMALAQARTWIGQEAAEASGREFLGFGKWSPPGLDLGGTPREGPDEDDE